MCDEFPLFCFLVKDKQGGTNDDYVTYVGTPYEGTPYEGTPSSRALTTWRHSFGTVRCPICHPVLVWSVLIITPGLLLLHSLSWLVVVFRDYFSMGLSRGCDIVPHSAAAAAKYSSCCRGLVFFQGLVGDRDQIKRNHLKWIWIGSY